MTMTLRGLALTSLLGATALTGTAGFAAADCAIASGRVSIVGNEFPAIQALAAKAADCKTGTVDVKANLTADHQKINVAGMSGNPAEYTSAIVATSSIVALMNEDVVRPLDDLVAAHGQNIPKNQLITVDGQVKAVAFMANAMHLVYRSDVLASVGVEPPATYEALLEAAEKIRAAGIMQYPVTGPYQAGWNLGNEFINMYHGHDGAFFKDGSAEPAVNGPAGIATLEMMGKVASYMNPDYLTHDSNAAQAEWLAGNAALINFWGSRAINLTVPENTTPEVYQNTKVAAPMTVAGGSSPASALWWDGWTVAKNISDEDAVATFKALAHASSPALLNAETMPLAVWMIEGFEPLEANKGVLASISAGTQPYPMRPYMGLMHTALGDNLPNYFKGTMTAAETLAAVEAAYTAAAKEKGFLN